MRIYVAGPMTGYPDFNAAAFDAATQRLRELGHEVACPMETSRRIWKQNGGSREAFENGKSTDEIYAAYLTADVRDILWCEAVALLKGWEGSIGATFEAVVGKMTGRKLLRFGIPGDLWPGIDHTHAGLAELYAAARGVGRGTQANSDKSATRQVAIGPTTPPKFEFWTLDGADPAESVLLEADRLVAVDRQVKYGHPFDNFTDIAGAWEWYRRSIGDRPYQAEDIALMMDLLKLARECKHFEPGYRDNRVDGPGYWKCLDLIVAERARREEK